MRLKIVFPIFFLFLIGFAMTAPSIGIEVTTNKPEYSIGDQITVTIKLINKGTDDMDVTFKVNGVSELDPRISILSARGGARRINPGEEKETDFFVDTAGLEPGVYTFTAIITRYVSESGDDDIIISDNIDSASIVLVRAPPTSVPEIPVVFVIFIVLAVLFIVRKN